MDKACRSHHTVAIERVQPIYPAEAPFHPDQAFPEYEGPIGSETNAIYTAVRSLWIDLGLDIPNLGTPRWNPLGGLIKPGQRVLIKPNIVLHKNHAGYAVDSVITHGSVVRAVADYVLKALGNGGQLIIGDAPLQSCSFALANQLSGLDRVVAFLIERGHEVVLRDFRQVSSENSFLGIRSEQKEVQDGYRAIDLGTKSFHHEHNPFEKFRVTNYDPEFMLRHHNETKHEYLVANSVLEADVVISMPKLKTHRKAGVTISMKNTVGINCYKDCLPHHKTGSIAQGGDEYLKTSVVKTLVTRLQEFEDVQESPAARIPVRFFKQILHSTCKSVCKDLTFEGSWWGNDTIWRTILDLNRILLYWNVQEGRLMDTLQRQFFSIVDGVIAGEGEGPLAPTPKLAGLLVGGINPAAVDVVCARLMGFDWHKIPTLVHGLRILADCQPNAIRVASSDSFFNRMDFFDPSHTYLTFAPTSGWVGKIEL